MNRRKEITPEIGKGRMWAKATEIQKYIHVLYIENLQKKIFEKIPRYVRQEPTTEETKKSSFNFTDKYLK